MTSSNSIPVLPLRDIVVFPNMVVPLFVGREASINALNEVMKTNKKILLITQTNPNIDLPKVEDLHKIGTIANVLQFLKLPDGTLKVLVEGQSKIKIDNFINLENYLTAKYTQIKNSVKSNEECKAYSNILSTHHFFGNLLNIHTEIFDFQNRSKRGKELCGRNLFLSFP